MNIIVSYRVKIKNRAYWETLDMGGCGFTSIGDAVAYLNQIYNTVYESSLYKETPNKQKIFMWSIMDKENTYNGVTELDNKNFLEKTINLDLSEYKKED